MNKINSMQNKLHFKAGDKVKMINCIEAKIYKNTIWTCLTDSYIDKSNDEVVFLDGFSGCFLVKYLQKQTLPKFLYEDEGRIKIGYIGDTDVTDEWNEFKEINL